jgi:ABC-2 type transport system permease protein
MNGAVFAHVWHSNIRRVVVVTAALVVWGMFLPIIYNAYGSVIKNIFASGSIPPQFQQFAEFGGGDLFSLSGSVALGFIHPIAVALVLVVAVGFTSLAIAGERQRGTLEILLSRPISRRGLVVTLAAAGALFVGLAVAGLVAGALIGAAVTGQTSALGVAQLPLLWLNGALLFWAIGAVALLASASFDRLGQALGITLAFVFVSYFLDVLGSLWPDAKALQAYSVFSYLDPKAILSGFPDASDFAVLAVIVLGALMTTLIIFPRRDLAAPS